MKFLKALLMAIVLMVFVSPAMAQRTGTTGNLSFWGYDRSVRIATLTTDTTLTVALHSDRIILLGEVNGDASLTVTLPAATGSGAILHFKVSVVNTSNYVIQVVDANDTIDGAIITLADAADTTAAWETASDSDTITLDATTTGGVSIGDWIELVDIATNQWTVTGITTSSGTEATPFSAAVS